jgi:hypothetical protein
MSPAITTTALEEDGDRLDIPLVLLPLVAAEDGAVPCLIATST